MAKYTKLPLEVEAIVWDGKDRDKINDFMGVPEDPDDINHAFDGDSGRLFIKTNDSTAIALPGDYVIHGTDDEFYPCKPGVFSSSYKAAE